MVQYIIDASLEGLELSLLNNKAALQRWIRAVAADYGFSLGDITYILCSDEKELAVNIEFLGHDFYTDVITFDYSTQDRVSGDIFISIDRVTDNAAIEGYSFESELLRVLIHGILHLTGQDDKTSETRAEMTRRENLALAKWEQMG